MKREKAEEKAKQMVGNTYRYDGNYVKIEDVEFKNGFAVFLTSSGHIHASLDNFEEEMEYFTCAKENSLVKVPQVLDMVVGTASVYDKLINTAMESIERIKTDAAYIPQAEAINGTIKSIVDLEKTKIAALSLLK